MKKQFIQTSLMFAAMLGISTNLCAENLSAENIQRKKRPTNTKLTFPQNIRCMRLCKGT